jgi:[ribosomal protein S5]-alanine N-acetyltransferase
VLSFRRSTPPAIETERMNLRLPELGDHAPWVLLRRSGEAFLRPWEPTWSQDHFTRRAFRNRVYWACRARDEGKALPLFLVRRDDRRLIGAITLDNIRRGPSQSAQVGYWIGPEHARQGYMREALTAVVRHAFDDLDLTRVEAACLPENVASRGLLEASGFAYEGMALRYLQINGRWRDHVLYARLRSDRAHPPEEEGATPCPTI